jgi:hypothetical protein
MARTRRIGIRWTIGNVSVEGFEALRLSIWGAVNVFGSTAAYAVCVNSVPLELAKRLTGTLPAGIAWMDVTGCLPEWIRSHLDQEMAEGVGWKFAPVRIFPDRYEVALDNDCILWSMPAALRAVLTVEPDSCIIAEDVRCCFGQFTDLCGSEPRNSGIRGTPAGFDLEAALRDTLHRRHCLLVSESDEQGLQVATLQGHGNLLAVHTSEVSICSPFPPHSPGLGTCGAHFVGLNSRNLPWEYQGRPASQVRREQWRKHLPALYQLVGLGQNEALPEVRHGN